MTTQQEALQAAQSFGVSGTLNRLAGEYDFNYAVCADNGDQYILKISHPATATTTLALQNAALHWLAKQTLPFAIPTPKMLTNGADMLFMPNAQTARLFQYVPGELLGTKPNHSAALLTSLGTQLGYLSAAFASFNHPAAARAMRWDFKQAEWVEAQLANLSPEQQALVVPFFQRFKTLVAPNLSAFRHSVIHGDLNDYNILVTNDAVTGFIDFGDIIETATISELAIALTYALLNKDDPLTAACHIISAYHAIFPLRDEEIAALYDLIAMRLCMSVVNSAERKLSNPEDAYLTISEAPAWELLKQWKTLDPHSVLTIFRSALLKDTPMSSSTAHLLALRKRLIGKNVSLSYDAPLQIVRGAGQYLFDETGKRYLDCVNNVCHVGHCHPDVVRAGQEQMALLNTNTRYLNAALTDYAAALLATLPKPLAVCFFVCSGSEANELALRLAKAHTKRHKVAVIDHGYHGNTDKLVQMSPYKFNGKGGQGKPDFVEVLPMPDPLRGGKPFSKLSTPVGAFIAESLLSCGGQIVLPAGFLADIYATVRRDGGVCIADEVQVGLGRIGSHFWGFESQGVVPDIVTLGKPLGNGHPLGAVVTTQEIADSFCNGMEYFNTFGGNPVSCRIGLSVLNVLEKEQLQQHAQTVGDYLKQQLTTLALTRNSIADVRGLGLFLGIELVDDKKLLTPAPLLARRVVNQLKERGILLSTDGPYENVLKIKPPMVFNCDNVDELVTNLAEVLF